MKKQLKKKTRIALCLATLFLLLFILLIVVVQTVDVRPIGPQGSKIGLSSLNQFVFKHLGVNLIGYYLTEGLGVVAMVVALSFAILGLGQLLIRKRLTKVDKNIIGLGVFYAAVLIAYIFFEIFVVNYRPILMEGSLEASFPSSHTMLSICIMATAIMQIPIYIKNKSFETTLRTVGVLIIVIMVGGRLISGVHWFTDILGGVLLGTSLTLFYKGFLIQNQ
ncbi:membrane-associated phospholipid phosphatase [Lachnospiraceae bacterium PF1-22]|uniref:phosphatase PAP2 family protein n=1 Tax=Ohessyouella blattaphilus TaxID=2949333 RepID=UPI003E2FC366